MTKFSFSPAIDELVFVQNEPSQANEDAKLVSRLLISRHGLAPERYAHLTDSQQKYVDNFVCSLIRTFIALIESYQSKPVKVSQGPVFDLLLDSKSGLD